jgi:hypothetical protein
MQNRKQTNSLPDLKSLILFASAQAEKLFRRQRVIYPMYHCIKSNGDNVILNAMDADKDLSVAMTKAWMQLNDVERYVFIDEAWILDNRKGDLPEIDIERARREGLSNHPDRREIVMFAAENRQSMQTARRFILRPEVGRPTLSPLIIDDIPDHSEGRMVGLLKRE